MNSYINPCENKTYAIYTQKSHAKKYFYFKILQQIHLVAALSIYKLIAFCIQPYSGRISLYTCICSGCKKVKLFVQDNLMQMIT